MVFDTFIELFHPEIVPILSFVQPIICHFDVCLFSPFVTLFLCRSSNNVTTYEMALEKKNDFAMKIGNVR